MYEKIFAHHLDLPRATLPGALVARHSVYAPTGQVYEVRSNGLAWVAVSPVHVGTMATLPASVDVPLGARARISDVRDVALFNTSSGWRPESGHCVPYLLEADTVPNVTPGGAELVAATATLPARLLRAGAQLRIQIAAEKVSGTTDTLALILRANSVAFFGAVIATTTRMLSADMRYRLADAVSMQKVGQGGDSVSWAGNSTAARAAAVALNDVGTTDNVITASLDMTTGTTEYGRLTEFTIELLS